MQGRMRVGVVSDTHGHREFTRRAIAVLDAQKVESVLHCGDIGSVEIVGLFSGWPTYFVFGNVDQNQEQLRAAIAKAGQTCCGRFGTLSLAGKRIAILHSDDHRRFQETVSGGEFDLVCYGHTHIAEHHYEGNTLVLNPGAVYRANPHSLAVVELPSLRVELLTLP